MPHLAVEDGVNRLNLEGPHILREGMRGEVEEEEVMLELPHLGTHEIPSERWRPGAPKKVGVKGLVNSS